MTKTRPAPLGATSDLELNQLGRTSPLQLAPSGAKRVLFNTIYKDFAPTELGRSIAKRGPRITTCSDALNNANLAKTAIHLTDETSVNSVSLADVAKGGDGATCPP